MPTIWEVAPGFDGDRVKLADGKAELAFTVKNPGTAPDRVMFSVVPGPGVDPDWFTIDEPQRPVGAGATTSYLVRLEVPPGTAPGAYELQMRAYSADSAPEETSVLSARIAFDVEAPAVDPKPPRKIPWLLILIILGVLIVVGLVVWLLTRGDDSEALAGEVELVAPADRAQVDGTEVTLSWKEVRGATKYRYVFEYLCAEGVECPDDPDPVPVEPTRAAGEGGEGEEGDEGTVLSTTVPVTDEMRTAGRVRWSIVAEGAGGDSKRSPRPYFDVVDSPDPDSGGGEATATSCIAGYVYRLVTPEDHVCVTQAHRDQVITDNALAGSRREPNGGPYGPDTCKQGFVWRDAVENDHVCVTPDIRTANAEANRDQELHSR